MAKSFLQLAVTGNLKKELDGAKVDFLRGNKAAVERIAAIAKVKLRGDVQRAGLGARLANTWRADVYPSGTRLAYSPAAQIKSKAPKIIQAHGEATIITARNAKYLAIPTENVPRRRNRLLTPVEIEIIFNQDLIFVKAPFGNRVLAFVNAVQSRGKKTRWRRATEKRTKTGREAQMVLMFVMVPQVHLRKRLNHAAIFAELERNWPEIHMQAFNQYALRSAA